MSANLHSQKVLFYLGKIHLKSDRLSLSETALFKWWSTSFWHRASSSSYVFHQSFWRTIWPCMPNLSSRNRGKISSSHQVVIRKYCNCFVQNCTLHSNNVKEGGTFHFLSLSLHLLSFFPGAKIESRALQTLSKAALIYELSIKWKS